MPDIHKSVVSVAISALERHKTKLFLVLLAEKMSRLEVLFRCICAAKFLQPSIIYIYFTHFFLDREVL